MHHAEAETLAAFVDGSLNREELDAVASHLQSCEECRSVIGEAVAFEVEETKKKRSIWVPIAAAAMVAVIAGAVIVPGKLQQREERKIMKDVQALHEAVLPKERFSGRLAEQNVYRDHRPKRGVPGQNENEDETLQRMRLQLAASTLLQTVGNDKSPVALRAVAAARAYGGSRPEALAILEAIPESARDAATWNDIAVLRNELSRKDALAAVDEALKKNPKMPEALFTRAAILYDAIDPRAIKAYEDYLKIDSQTDWAKEARQNIKDLKEPQ